MKKMFILALGAAFMISSTTTAFSAPQTHEKSVKATDIPYIPSDDDSGPYTDPEPTPDPGPDSTDSGDSWDSGSSGGGDVDGSGSDVLF